MSQSHPLFLLLRQVIEHRSTLTRDQAREWLDLVLAGHATDVELAAMLGALASRGETPQESAGMVDAMRAVATTLPLSGAEREVLVDTCGTGGDASGTFNVSTAAGLVAAAAGATVAKHGNRAVTSASGSADVLEALGVPVGLGPAEAERAIAGLGLQLSIERQYYSPQIPEGRIMSQLPMPGTKVRRGWQVRVAQSLGPTRVAIPDVTGQSEHAAELNIRRRGLDITSMAQVVAPGIPADQVLAQSPPANATQVAAPNISLLLTGAAQTQAFVMPSFIGQSLGSVSRTLQDEGFRLGNVSVAAPTAAPTGDVAASPDAATATAAMSRTSTTLTCESLAGAKNRPCDAMD